MFAAQKKEPCDFIRAAPRRAAIGSSDLAGSLFPLVALSDEAERMKPHG